MSNCPSSDDPDLHAALWGQVSSTRNKLGLKRIELKHQRGEIEAQIRELKRHPDYHDSDEWDYVYDGHDEFPVGPFTSDWLEEEIFPLQEALWDINRKIGEINTAIDESKQ